MNHHLVTVAFAATILAASSSLPAVAESIGVGVGASIGGSSGINAGASASIGGSSGIDAGAGATIGGSGGVEAGAGISIGDGVDVGLGVGIGGTTTTPPNPGTPNPVHPGIPGVVAQMSPAELQQTRKRCATVMAQAATFDSDLVALCRLVQTASR